MSNWVTYAMRAPTEADAKTAAIAAVKHGFDLVRQDEDGEWQWSTSSMRHEFDVIGPAMTAPGTYDEEGNELTAPVFDERWHANLIVRKEVAEGVLALLLNLGKPHGVEIGIETGRHFA